LVFTRAAGKSQQPSAAVNLPNSIKTIISEVEDSSGLPVNVQEDRSLKTLAAVSVARGGALFHSLTYRPDAVGVHYVIAFQLGFIIRKLRPPEESRFEVVSEPDHFKKAVADFDLGKFPPALAKQLFDSLIIQLRSISVGDRVDQWIIEEHPEFIPEQEASVKSQLKENQQALSPEIRKMFPGKILNANLAMNAAYARVWSERLKDARYGLVYKAAGYGEVADKLVSCWNQTSASPEFDQDLIAGWAKVLSLVPYFTFKQ
jgi:hypothetical protein